MFTAFPFVRLTAHFHPFTPSSPGQTIPPWLPLATGAVLGRNPFASTFGHSWIVEQIPPADTGRTTTIRPLTNTKVVSLCLARAFCRLLTILIYSICKNLIHLYKEEPRLKLSLFLVNSVHTAFFIGRHPSLNSLTWREKIVLNFKLFFSCRPWTRIFLLVFKRKLRHVRIMYIEKSWSHN